MRVVGFDIETSQLSPYHAGARILTAAWATSAAEPGVGVVIDHPLAPAASSIKAHRILRVQRILGDAQVTIAGHNIAGFDVPWWEQVTGHEVRAQLFDTRVAYALLDEESNENSLGALSTKFGLGVKNEDGLDRRRLSEADPALVLKYNSEDARLSLALQGVLEEKLRQEGLLRLFRFLMLVARTLADMRGVGTYVDLGWVKRQRKEIEQQLEQVDSDLRVMLGDEAQEINLASPKQLGTLLYDRFGMPVIARSKKTGAPSTSTDALRELRSRARVKEARQLLDAILEHRKLSKLVGTYLVPLEEEHRGEDGRVHTTFHLGKGYGEQAGGTVTGRLSSSQPNLQNIPRDERIKGAFAPTPGMLLFSADYSQVELRVAAWMAGERTMVDAFAAGRDVHTATLAEMEGRSYEEVNELVKSGDRHWEEQRALVKRVNFGVLYGVGAFRLVKLMRDMGIHISLRRAEGLLEWWFSTKPQMKAWIDRVHETAVEHKRVVTPTGRVRHLPDAVWGTPWGERALRQSVNFLVQSFSADLMLMALLLLDRKLQEEGGARLLLTVHDSVVGEYLPDQWDSAELSGVVRKIMVQDAYAALRKQFKVESGLLLDVDIKPGQERWLK